MNSRIDGCCGGAGCLLVAIYMAAPSLTQSFRHLPAGGDREHHAAALATLMHSFMQLDFSIWLTPDEVRIYNVRTFEHITF